MLARMSGPGIALALAVGLFWPDPGVAQIVQPDKISDVRGTKHNLSAVADGSATPSGGRVPTRAVKATSETQVCVFCHTPHNAEPIVFGTGANASTAPLWNRKLSGQTYSTYTSTSMEASASELGAGPGGTSKLCLSCHDGTLGVDKVSNLNGARDIDVPMNTASPVSMPNPPAAQGGALGGFTRNIGSDLTSDHPISFTYDATLAAYDGELRAPDGVVVGTRSAGSTPPLLPLERGQVQCSTCHDPHLRDRATSNGNAKFLRASRFQVSQPLTTFSATRDIICLACHDKGGLSWSYSAHAHAGVATQSYKADAAQLREFPSSNDSPANQNPRVWQVSCLNCHDTHSVQGSRRLLREGTDSTTTPKSGGNSAMEETCFQCHTTAGDSAVTYTANTSTAIPDIKSDYVNTNRRMPLRSSEQAAATEVHEIGGTFNDAVAANCSPTSGQCGKDLLESRARLGHGNLNNRHAECSDCHNPHRVIRSQNGLPGTLTASNTNGTSGTHRHDDATGYTHTNLISGVLRGAWGVEPVYSSTSFHAMPNDTFLVKRGDPGSSSSTLVTEPYVTREYQICMKCHSNYGYSDNNLYPNGNRPMLGSPGTPSGTNGLTMYTNQAKDFQAPSTHQGPAAAGCINQGTNAGANSAFNNCNHRSWHPVMEPTGRTTAGRGMSSAGGWRTPWSNAIGSSTMYCSDCHGSNTAGTTVIPAGGENGSPWGPHGSANNFLLKGVWGAGMGATGRSSGVTANLLCFKCHSPATYSTNSDSGRTSGFWNSSRGNLHNYHVDKVGSLHCTWCHVAVPHGWKNKSLLVNLNDVGQEAGQPEGASKEVAISANSHVYNQEPYYLGARNKIRSFAQSGSWSASNCGSAGKSGTGLTTGVIPRTPGGATTNTTSTAETWMRAVCTGNP